MFLAGMQVASALAPSRGIRPAGKRSTDYFGKPGARSGGRRLSLNKHGNSEHAFGWSHLPEVKLWQQARCA